MWIFTANIRPMIPGTVVGPALMPRICGVAFVVLGAIVAWSALRSDAAGIEDEQCVGRPRATVIVVPLLLIVIWLLAPVVGLLTLTGLSGAILARLMGGRWIIAAPGAVILCIAVHLLFVEGMRIQMPQGLFY
ncbi:tripartite tricarboxylate transporter TctB family protein [Rhodobacteraceae bacterium R_SAG2]|nr:tripartite tricarboxylate transporter TctB family protein [Rhodobacteraceae bacterium R_SAG2]